MSPWYTRIGQALKRKDSSGRILHPSDPSGSGASVGLPSPGAVISNRYRLDAEIGRGGMGIVYRATDLKDGNPVAVKLIHPDVAVDNLARFEREARIMASLHHPHLVRVLDTGTFDGEGNSTTSFIVMEYVKGKNLRDLGDLAISQILDIAIQICDALQYIHSVGLIHRDIKPENVLVEPQGLDYSIKLSDFGLAEYGDKKAEERKTPLVGSVYYLAPEVISGKPADNSADLYSFGVVLYEMVTGRTPFSNYDEASILAQHLHDVPTPPSHSRAGIPVGLETIIMKLLSKEPSARFANAEEVCAALHSVQESVRSSVAGNLPDQSSISLASDADVQRLKSLVLSNRVVQVAGGTASERTRITNAVARDLVTSFPDGAWLVELESCKDSASVLARLASTLGIISEDGRSIAVKVRDHLRDKRMLLVLDRCDEIAGVCKQLSEMLVASCPAVRIITSSDRALEIPQSGTLALDE